MDFFLDTTVKTMALFLKGGICQFVQNYPTQNVIEFSIILIMYKVSFHKTVRRTSSYSPGVHRLESIFLFYFPFIHLHFALWNTSARLCSSHPFLSA